MRYGFSFLSKENRKSSNLLYSINLEESIRQSIILILATEKGERKLSPHFGAQLRQFIFRRRDSHLKNQIQEHIHEALNALEPRIQVDRIETEIDDQSVEIVIRYTILETQTKQSLIYPMKLFE